MLVADGVVVAVRDREELKESIDNGCYREAEGVGGTDGVDAIGFGDAEL